MFKQYLFVIFLVLMFGCNQSCRKNDCTNNNSNVRISNKKADSICKVNLEIVNQAMVMDTLQIVSTQKLLYYPFGEHNNIQNFSKKFPLKTKIKETNQDNDMFYIFFLGKSRVTAFLSEDFFGKYERIVNIINSEINDNSIILYDTVRIGITKSNFAQIFNLNDVEGFEDIRVIEFISALSGIWHYYTFDENDRLKKIEIKTDYTFE